MREAGEREGSPNEGVPNAACCQGVLRVARWRWLLRARARHLGTGIMTAFVAGCFIGCAVGVLVMAVLAMARGAS